MLICAMSESTCITYNTHSRKKLGISNSKPCSLLSSLGPRNGWENIHPPCLHLGYPHNKEEAAETSKEGPKMFLRLQEKLL